MPSPEVIIANTSKFMIGTSVVLFATYLYNFSPEREPPPPPIKIHDYEKTTVDRNRKQENEAPRKGPRTPLKSAGLSTSRPGSPDGHHFRTGSSRDYFGAKARDD